MLTFTFTAAQVPHILIGLLVYGSLHYFISMFYDQKVRRSKTIAFFHPYCDGGGGGERVLWIMIRVLFDTFQVFKRPSYDKPGIEIVIYSGEITKTKDQIVDNVINKFGIAFTTDERAHIQLINIQTRLLLEAKWYPVATLILQSLAGAFVGLESVIRRRPDVYIDTMGCALAYPLVRLLFARRVVAYVHYPAISTDMLQKVWQRRPGYNNNTWITSNAISSHLKLVYYRLFAVLYGWAGRSCDRVLANSTWTRAHLIQLGWGQPVNTTQLDNDSSQQNDHGIGLLYPPCGSTEENIVKQSRKTNSTAGDDDGWENDQQCRDIFTTASSEQARKPFILLSVGQFRPEKDHLLQVRVMAELIKQLKSSKNPTLQEIEPRLSLVMLGSTRHKQDEAIVLSLQQEIVSLGFENRAHVLTNRSVSILKKCLQCATIGLHSMWNEHFGISVVEMLSSGLLTIAHGSGGPKADIIQPYKRTVSSSDSEKGDVQETNKNSSKSTGNGFLACEIQEYVDKAIEAITLVINGVDQEVRNRAKTSALQFKDEAFAIQWAKEAQNILRDL